MAISQELQDAISFGYTEFVATTNAAQPLYLDNESNRQILEDALQNQGVPPGDWVYPKVWTLAWTDSLALLELPLVDEEEIARRAAAKTQERERKLRLKDFRDGSPAGNRTSLQDEARRDLRTIHQGIADRILENAKELSNSLPEQAAAAKELPTPEQIADGTSLSKRELEKLNTAELKKYISRTRRAEEIVRQRNRESNDV